MVGGDAAEEGADVGQVVVDGGETTESVLVDLGRWRWRWLRRSLRLLVVAGF